MRVRLGLGLLLAAVTAPMAANWLFAQEGPNIPIDPLQPGRATVEPAAGDGFGGGLPSATKPPGATPYGSRPSVDFFYTDSDPRARAADRQIREQLRAYTGAQTDADRAARRDELSKLLALQFDARQQRREQEIAELEARVNKLKETLRKRSDAKGTIVGARLDQLLRDAEGLGWGDEGAGSGGDYRSGFGNVFQHSYRAVSPPAAVPYDVPRAVNTVPVTPAPGATPSRRALPPGAPPAATPPLRSVR